MFDLLETHSVRRQRQADHEGREEILEIPSEGPFLISHPEQSRRGLMHFVVGPGWVVFRKMARRGRRTSVEESSSIRSVTIHRESIQSDLGSLALGFGSMVVRGRRAGRAVGISLQSWDQSGVSPA